MSEEIKHSGAEINEAELTGVSGGAGTLSYEIFYNQQHRICAPCPKWSDNERCDKGHDLCDYLHKNGDPRCISRYTECPWYE